MLFCFYYFLNTFLSKRPSNKKYGGGNGYKLIPHVCQLLCTTKYVKLPFLCVCLCCLLCIIMRIEKMLIFTKFSSDSSNTAPLSFLCQFVCTLGARVFVSGCVCVC